METAKIKKFATEARNILKAGIAARLTGLGFDRKGQVPENNKPQLLQGGCIWNGRTLPEGFYHQWTRLYDEVQRRGVNEVYEEAAYTWFNRLCAIRILQKNGLCEPVSTYADSARTPQLVNQARQGIFPPMDEATKRHLMDLLDDDTQVTEQFAVLLVAWCHANPILQRCFGAMADYTELLLPANILAENGFIDLLNHTEFITDEDFQSPELIGWLYQFYISERKDEVFAKKGKFEADEIPAATQIFTPNWIVKYMVQNTVGRIYLDNNPYERQLQKKWQYLVEPSEKTASENVLHYDELTDLRVADLACGSGHILNECFDLLYDLYIAEGYGRGEAVENIFNHNLTGIDLDTRAKQLSQFALLLKACQKDASFADAHILPHVMDMAHVSPKMDEKTLSEACLEFMGGYENVAGEMLAEDFELLKEAEHLGSIMCFNNDKDYLSMLRHHYAEWTENGTDDCPENIKLLLPGVKVILALTENYHALVMNPPYMGSGRFDKVLAKYVKEEYEEGKADLFSVFMQMGMECLATNGKMAQINMQSWMFLSSFEKLRTQFLTHYNIDNMLHLGPRTFDELSGEVVQNTAFVLSKHEPTKQGGVYYRLIEGKNCADKEQLFLSHIHGNEDGNRIYYPNVEQKNFGKIPGCPIGYWVSKKILSLFEKPIKIKDVSPARIGMMTTDNIRFTKNWTEVSLKSIGFGFDNKEAAVESEYKWFPYNKGGGFKRWYGLNELIVNWQYGGKEIIKNGMTSFRGKDFYFKEGITWSFISSTKFGVRYKTRGFLFDIQGSSSFPKENELYDVMGYLNSKVSYSLLSILNPTLSFQGGNINSLPYIKVDTSTIYSLVHQNIAISRSDWDAHETSWDFQRNELLSIDADTYMENINYKIEKHFEETGERICIDPVAPQLDSLEWRMEQYKTKWERKFMQLHKNEEELNRQFIDIYGLQDELTPDVPLDEITILQQGEVSIEANDLKWHDDVLIKQFLSYAAGVWMGRYRLGHDGLHIAHPGATAEELASYDYKGHTIEIDDDGIFPLMAADSGFTDNACLRTAQFVSDVFGADSQVANLNYIERTLGKTIEQYWIKDFWKDHKKMYQNRPIYWLFASKKGTFQCIAYLHRMTPYTPERIRSKYLLPFIETLTRRVTDMALRIQELSTKEMKQLDTLRKQIEECREYHDRLAVIAEQAIPLDLDDGVVVNYAKLGDVVAKLK